MKQWTNVQFFEYKDALASLVVAGIKPEDVEHQVTVAGDISLDFAEAMDAIVLKRVTEGPCVHPQSLYIATALLMEKFLAVRMSSAGEKVFDPIKYIEAVRKFVMVEAEEDIETPTVH